jgi:hypothetical protein
MKTFNFTVNQNITELTIKSQNKVIFSAKFSNGYIKFKDNYLIVSINDTCMMTATYKLNYSEMMGLKYQIQNAYSKV